MTPAQREIIESVAAKHGLTVEHLTSRVQTRRIARPRQEAMHDLLEAKRWSTTQIGAALNRDHATVLHGVRKHRARLTLSPKCASPLGGPTLTLEAINPLPTTIPRRGAG